jgi:hypothetical protein
LGKLISISVWKEEKDRSILVDERFTEKDAARMRGYVRWKIMNKRAMDERDSLLPPAPAPRPWPPYTKKQ